MEKLYYANLTDGGSGAIIAWNDGGPWLEDSITIAGTRYLLTKQLDAPGVYLLPHFELVYSIQAGCHPGNCMISSDLNFIAEWRADSWPPGLRCYNRGIITGEVDGVSIFRSYSAMRNFTLSSKDLSLRDSEFTSDGKLMTGNSDAWASLVRRFFTKSIFGESDG